MYLIDETYFQRYDIPNINELNTGALTNLERFVDEYARLVLKKALGYTLFNEFNAYVIDGVLTSAPAKWESLVDGKTYTKDGTTYKWNGLLLTEGQSKQSLLTPFVYYYWLLDRQQRQTGVGTVTVNSKNATNVNATQTLTNAWNEFVTLYQYDCDGYDNFYVDYVWFIGYWDTNDDTNYVSLIKFIEDNDTDYPDAALFRYDYKNSFGL